MVLFRWLVSGDSPEQRRLGIKDSKELAWQDWLGTAGFNREEDEDSWARKWAEAYVDFTAGEKRAWLYEMGVRFLPVVGWAERGGYLTEGHGNSVPRFHIVWGTGPAIVAPFERRVREHMKNGLIEYRPRHLVDNLINRNGAIVRVGGSIIAPSSVIRGEDSTREVIGEFEYTAEAVLIASGGIGGNHDLVRKNWPSRLGQPPTHMLSGVPAHVDGRMLAITEEAGIRIVPGPSSIWLDATGQLFPAPYFPGFDTLGTLEAIQKTGYPYSWFILTQKIIQKEFALSGSEQNPDR